MLVVPHFSPPMMIRFGIAAWRLRLRGIRLLRSPVNRSRARAHIASSEGSAGTLEGVWNWVRVSGTAG